MLADKTEVCSALEDASLATPFYDSPLFRKCALPSLEAVLEDGPSAVRIIRAISEYYEKKNWPLEKIAFALEALSNKELSISHCCTLETAMRSYMRRELPLGSLVSGFLEILKKGTGQEILERLNPSHLRVYSEARSEMIRYLRNGFAPDDGTAILSKLQELSADTITLLKLGTSPLELRLYYALVIKGLGSSNISNGLCGGEMKEAFKALIDSKPEGKPARFLVKLLDPMPEGMDLPRALKAYAKVVTSISEGNPKSLNGEKWRILSSTLESIAPKGLPLIEYMDTLLALGLKNLSLAEIRLVNEAYCYHAGISSINQHHSALLKLKQTCEDILGKDLPDAYLGNYSRAIQSGYLRTEDESFELLRKMAQHALAFTYLRSPAEFKRRGALGILRSYSNFPHRSIPDSERSTANSEGSLRNFFRQYEFTNLYREPLTFEKSGFYYMNRMMDVFHGFSALTFECKRPPSREPPLIARFGNDVGEVKYINAKDIDAFPGRGFLISALKMQKIFAAQDSSEDPFKEYKESWPGLALEFEDLTKASFLLCRGMIAISCPGLKYRLAGATGDPVEYSYVIFNEHFKNPGCKVAFLVPTPLLMEKVQSSLLGFEDFVGFDPTKSDINVTIPSPESLFDDDLNYPLGVIDIGSADNIVKGFNVRLQSILVERDPEISNLVSKLNEQIRSWNGGVMYKYGSPIREQTRDEILILGSKIEESKDKFRIAGRDLSGVINSYQNLFDLVRIALALWHKGQTAGSGSMLKEFNALDQGDPEYDSAGSFEYNPHALRMLKEAYIWHQGGLEVGLKRKEFPILIKASALDYWRIPESPFYIDTYNLTGVVNGKSFELSEWSDGTGPEESEFWITKILPFMEGSNDDFRFFDRKGLMMN